MQFTNLFKSVRLSLIALLAVVAVLQGLPTVSAPPQDAHASSKILSRLATPQVSAATLRFGRGPL